MNVPTAKTKFASRWLPPAPPKPDTLQIRVVGHPAPPPKARRVQPAPPAGEPYMLAEVNFPQTNTHVGVDSAGAFIVLDDRGHAAGLQELQRLLDLLRPPAPPPRTWLDRLLRRE